MQRHKQKVGIKLRRASAICVMAVASEQQAADPEKVPQIDGAVFTPV